MLNLMKISLTLFVLSFFSVSAFAINGMYMDGQGARSMGMGAASIAVVNDSTAIFSNPSAIAFNKGGMVDLNVDILIPAPSFKNKHNPATKSGRDLVVGVPAGGFYNTKEIYGDYRLGYGFGFFPAAGLASEYQLNNPLYNEQVYESEAGLFKILPAVALQVNNFSIGVSAGPAYQNMQMALPFTAQEGSLAGFIMLADMRASGFGWTANVGALYKLGDLQIGVTYKSETKIDISGDARLDMYAQNDAAVALGLLPAGAVTDPTANYDVDITFRWPQTFGFGVSYKPIKKLVVAIDFEWIDWSSVMDKIKVDFTNGSNAEISDLAGGDSISDYIPAEWDDQYVIRGGVEYQVRDDLKLRTGLIYAKSPIPDDTLIPILCVITELSATIGLGYTIAENSEFDFAFQYSFNHKQKYIGRDHKVSSEYDYSATDLTLYVIHIGMKQKF